MERQKKEEVAISISQSKYLGIMLMHFLKSYKQIDQPESRRAGSRSLIFILNFVLLVHKLKGPTVHLHFTDI
jgi:hypothetical protein